MTSAAKIVPKGLPGSFSVLCQILPLKPIRSETALRRAQAVADRLAVLDRRTREQEEYLETLSLLIERYEEEHHQIDTSDLEPLETLQYLLELHNMTASDLGRLLGQRQLGAKVLAGERELSKAHIAKLSAHFGVDAGVFLKPRL